MYRVKSGSKFHNESENYNGHHYDSKAEAGYAKSLDLRLRAGDIKSWKPHVKLELFANGQHVGNYEIDFMVTHKDGHIEFVEVKGMRTPLWRLKWRLFEATYEQQWPGADLTVIQVPGRRQRWTQADVNRAKKRVQNGRIFGRKAT